MTGLKNLGSSLVGKKLIAAITGLILLLFLLAHMAGNLKAFTGADAEGIPHIDVYAEFLRSVGEPAIPYGTVLWATRLILLISLVLHVVVVVQLAIANRAARPVRYEVYRTRASSFAAKSMMFTGLAILLFVVFHILHLTTGTIQVGPFKHGQVYANLYYSFRQPIVAIGYLLMMLLVGVHLLHGGWSLFQTWGLDQPGRNRALRRTALIVALLIALGFSSLPLLFMFGILPEPSALVPANTIVGG